MKLTKKQEQEIMQVYEAYWAEYLNGNVKGIVPLLDASYTQVGSAESEVFSSKKEAVQFLVDTIDQVSGKLEMRNRSTKLELQDHLILIHELCDLYALADKKWVFYSKFRASTLLQEKKEGWRITHQHSSFPDTKTEEGQNVAIEKIAAENQHLREAVKRRTVELEQKNRELQIEAALERVRARAMAMQSSKELAELVDTVFKELTQLDFELSWCMINIIDAPNLSNTVWTINSETGKIPESFHMKFEDYPFHDAMMKGYKDRATKYLYVLEGAEKKIYDEYLFNETEFTKIPQEAQAASRAMERYVCSFSFSNFGGLQTVGVKPLTNINLDILARFGKVFDLTYTRFIDLKLAEAQAKESRIELALERVRARTMAMQKSEELTEASFILDAQVRELGMNTWGCAFNIYGEEESKEWFGNKEGELNTYTVPRVGIFKEYYDKGQQGETLLIKEFSGEECVAHYEFMSSLPVIGDVLKTLKETNNGFPTYQIDHVVYFKYGYLLFITREPVPDAHDIFKRFAKVFEQTYTRFLDLQKAEAQAREAQIETALERVRARTMAMQKSDELEEVIQVVYDQFILLNINIEHTGFILDYKQNDSMHIWLTDQREVPSEVTIPYFDTAHWNSFNEAKEKGLNFFTNKLGFEEKNRFYKELFQLIPGVPDETIDHYLKVPGLAISTVLLDDVGLYIENFDGIPYTDEENTTLMRFGIVFQQTYTRFLDLQKAEAQARESQIEAALERVRSRTMAMHKSEELAETALVLYEQFSVLGNIPDRMSIGIFKEETKEIELWPTDQSGSQLNKKFTGSFEKSANMTNIYEAWKADNDSFIVDLSGEKLKTWLKFIREEIKLFVDDSHIMGRRVQQAAFFSHGMLLFTTNEPIADEIMQLLIRFAHVFSQTYTRFLDLQKAEAQARESQIEAALEKVRSRSLAMHKSEELREVVLEVHEKFQELEISMESRVAVIVVFEEDSRNYNQWIASDDFSNMYISTPYFKHRVLDDFWKAKHEGLDFYSGAYTVDEKNSYFQTFFEISNYTRTAEIEVQAEWVYDQKFYAYSPAFQKNSSVGIADFSGIPLTDGEIEIIKRFSKVFEQAYIRFLDLQKAEAQAREAQIEGALERVRSKTMAMHNSEDLEDIVVSLFDEVLNLGLDKSIRCGIGILEGYEGMETRSVNSNSDGSVDLRVGMLNMTIHPMLVGLKKAWKKGSKGYSYEYTGKDVRKYYEALNNEPEYPFNANLETLPEQEFHRSFFYSSGILFTFSETPISEESARILERFAAVFGQTYRRFLDLQTAEAQAREATKQASLDRVRGQIASMRSTTDLDRITPLVWNELTTMGVPFMRCGVFIIDEPTEIVHAYLSAPDGHSLGVLHLRFNADPLTENTVAHWRKGHIFKKHWNREEFISWTQSLIEQGKISDKNTYQGAADPPESLDLHFIPFTQGMLYVGNENPLNNKQIDLVQSLADAFAIAYARYEDFTKLEKAKESVEATLNELKTTQNQLVQSEKMASLGELTAGIAHEIQNPLNFVNNFSEVSNELIDEMNEEIEKGDLEEAKAIASDIKQNLEKINHHGKRADGIVKGMLQHSRSSSGVKEPTDINALTDEYLRLAYHGLRAKDKSFNATMDTNFDENLEKINIIPQDIGRVILNLLTNAFYIVNEKKQLDIDGYKPTVSVSTKKEENHIIISVQDNGNGIPKKVLEKIFQPFFTTKPTGQGTGLGLSMSYDIITKGHGGELKVKTKENLGSTFIISLPQI